MDGEIACSIDFVGNELGWSRYLGPADDRKAQ